MSKNCDICGKTLKLFKKCKLKDGNICLECANSLGFDLSNNSSAIELINLSANRIQEYIKAKDEIGVEAVISMRREDRADMDAKHLVLLQKMEQGQLELNAKRQEFEQKKAEMQTTRTSQEPTAPVTCPKCGSTQISADKKGYSVGKAVLGATVSLGVGAVAGTIGSKKVIITCLKCGHQWKAGKA